MNAEEWLRENERIDNMPPYHRGADAFQYLCEEAANIIRALLAENERLKGAMNRAIKLICDCPEGDDGKSGECVRNPDFKSEICADHWLEYLLQEMVEEREYK